VQWIPKQWEKENLWEEGVHIAQCFRKVNAKLKDLVVLGKQHFLAWHKKQCSVQGLEYLTTNFTDFLIDFENFYLNTYIHYTFKQ